MYTSDVPLRDFDNSIEGLQQYLDKSKKVVNKMGLNVNTKKKNENQK